MPVLIKRALFGGPSVPSEMEMAENQTTAQQGDFEGVAGASPMSDDNSIIQRGSTIMIQRANTTILTPIGRNSTMTPIGSTLLAHPGRPKDLLWHFANNEYCIDDTAVMPTGGQVAGQHIAQQTSEITVDPNGYGVTADQMEEEEEEDISVKSQMDMMFPDLDVVLETVATNDDAAKTSKNPEISQMDHMEHMDTLYADVDAVLDDVENFTDQEYSKLE